jgi:hypothetical protein
MGRIKAVEREYKVIRFGTDRLIVAAKDDPAILKGAVMRPDINTASAHLDGTYLVRVFAEFETALRKFTSVFHIRRPGSTEALVNRVRDRGHVPQLETDAVHRVRDLSKSLGARSVGERRSGQHQGSDGLSMHVFEPRSEDMVTEARLRVTNHLIVGVFDPTVSRAGGRTPHSRGPRPRTSARVPWPACRGVCPCGCRTSLRGGGR